MTCNPRVLGLVLLTVFALGTEGALAADAHQFRFDGQKTVLTGKSTNTHEFVVGTAGAIKCTNATFESTVDAGAGETEVDAITVKPTYSECSFGGQPAQVSMNDCAYVFDSDTAAGNTTGASHAGFAIECAPGHKIQMDISVCTITFGPQEVATAVRYENDTASSIGFTMTGHQIVNGKEKTTPSQTGCLLWGTGAIYTYHGSITNECRTDEGEPQANSTTPTGTQDATTTECAVTDL